MSEYQPWFDWMEKDGGHYEIDDDLPEDRWYLLPQSWWRRWQ